MRVGKGKVIAIVPIMVVVAIFVSYFWGWEIGAYFHPDETVYNLEELSELISKQVEEGKKSARVYIQGVEEAEINTINDHITSKNGVVSQFTIQEKLRSGIKVYFKYEISDNYYVINKYINGDSIPNDRPQAHKLYEVVSDIISKNITEDMGDYAKELAIHDYIVKNCKYGYVEYSKDYAYKAYGCLVQNQAVCNGYAEAMSLLLTCVGIENKIVTGEGREDLHAWNQVMVNGRWYNVDATWDDPLPDRGNYAGHMFFNVTDEVMAVDHKWDKEAFDVCNNMKMNYFMMNDLVCDYDRAVVRIEDMATRDPNAICEIVLKDYSTDKYMGFSFVCDNPGVDCYTYTLEPFGDMQIATIYLNQRK